MMVRVFLDATKLKVEYVHEKIWYATSEWKAEAIMKSNLGQNVNASTTIPSLFVYGAIYYIMLCAIKMCSM